MRQADIFLASEGDAWHARNKDKPRLPDPVIEAMKACNLQPKTVLELGCGNGWRLAEIQKLWPSAVFCGYDASREAVLDRQFEGVYQADILGALKSTRNSFYDVIIFGFCLYLIDREDLMMIAAHTDRVLKDGGHIIIHDFCDGPYKVAYKHKEGVWSYHDRYPNLWLSNPAYSVIEGRALENNVRVHVLRKDLASAYPERTI